MAGASCAAYRDRRDASKEHIAGDSDGFACPTGGRVNIEDLGVEIIG